MSTRTTNYNFIIGEGSDVVNPLTQIFPNFTSLDDILRAIANTGITTATELVTGTVHALTRDDANVSVFRFQATSNFTSGETFTVDGAQVTALDVSGETLKTGAYIIGSMVLCELRDTLLTVYVSGSSDAQTLEGHSASYFAKQTDLATVDGKADANKTLIDGLSAELTTLTSPNDYTLSGWATVNAQSAVDVDRQIAIPSGATVDYVEFFSNAPLMMTTYSVVYIGGVTPAIRMKLYNASSSNHTLTSSDYIIVHYR